MHTQCNRSGFARENSTFCRTGRSASTRARSNAYVHTELQCKHRHAVSLRKINSEFSWTLFGHFSPNRARPHVFSISAGCFECKQKTETGSLMRLFFFMFRERARLWQFVFVPAVSSQNALLAEDNSALRLMSLQSGNWIYPCSKAQRSAATRLLCRWGQNQENVFNLDQGLSNFQLWYHFQPVNPQIWPVTRCR